MSIDIYFKQHRIASFMLASDAYNFMHYFQDQNPDCFYVFRKDGRKMSSKAAFADILAVAY